MLSRVSPRVIISRSPSNVCFDNTIFVLALSDPYHFGILQSAVHSTWSHARGSTLETRLRYTNTTVFETFPFPLQQDGTYDVVSVPQTSAAERIRDAAKRFDRLRADACQERQQGLTKVNNAMEAGELPDLARAYEALNDAVEECYGFPTGTWRDPAKTLAKLLELNRKVAAQQSAPRTPQTGHLFTHMLVSTKPDRNRPGIAQRTSEASVNRTSGGQGPGQDSQPARRAR